MKTKLNEAERAHHLKLSDMKKERDIVGKGERELLVKKLFNATEINTKLQKIAGRKGVTTR